MLIFRGYYSCMKARAGTFSTEEFAMGCSDQGGLPGRRGLRVRDSQVKVWLSARQVCECSKGETDWQVHGQHRGCYHWGALKLRLLPKPIGLRRLTDSPARSGRPAGSRISSSDISLLVAQVGCKLLKPLPLSLESCVWFLNRVKNKLGSLARSQSSLPFL